VNAAFDPPLDAGIAPYVEVLHAAGVETYESCESCEGGAGHSYAEPTVCFHGRQEEGPRAFAVARAHGLPVASLCRVWDVVDGELVGPTWKMTFAKPAGGAP